MSLEFAAVEPLRPRYRSTKTMVGTRVTADMTGLLDLESRIRVGEIPDLSPQAGVHLSVEEGAQLTRKICYEHRPNSERSLLAKQIKSLRNKAESLRKEAMEKHRTDRRLAWAKFKAQCRYWKEWGTYIVKDRGRYGDYVRIPTKWETRCVTYRVRDRQVLKWIYDRVKEYRVNRHGKTYEVWVRKNYRLEYRWIYRTVSRTYRRAVAWKSVRRWVIRRIPKPIIGKNGKTGRWLLDRKKLESLKQQWYIEHYALRYLNDTDYFIVEQELEDARFRLHSLPHSEFNSAAYECNAAATPFKGVETAFEIERQGRFQHSSLNIALPYGVSVRGSGGKSIGVYMYANRQVVHYRDGRTPSSTSIKYWGEDDKIAFNGGPRGSGTLSARVFSFDFVSDQWSDAKNAMDSLEQAYWKEAALEWTEQQESLERIVVENTVEGKETLKLVNGAVVKEFCEELRTLKHQAELARMIPRLPVSFAAKLQITSGFAHDITKLTVKQIAGVYLCWKFGVEPLISDVTALCTLSFQTWYKLRKGLAQFLRDSEDKTSIPLVARAPKEAKRAPVPCEISDESTSRDEYRIYVDYPQTGEPASIWYLNRVEEFSRALQEGDMTRVCECFPHRLVKIDDFGNEVDVPLAGPLGPPCIFSKANWKNESPGFRDFVKLTEKNRKTNLRDIPYTQRFTRLRAFARWKVEQLREAERSTLRDLVDTSVYRNAYAGAATRTAFEGLRLAWELYPLSFVTNWFSNVDRVLSRMTVLSHATDFGFPEDGIWGSMRAELFIGLPQVALSHTRNLYFPDPLEHLDVEVPRGIGSSIESIELWGRSFYIIEDNWTLKVDVNNMLPSGITSYVRSPLQPDVDLRTFIPALSLERLQSAGKLLSVLAICIGFLPIVRASIPITRVSKDRIKIGLSRGGLLQ